MKSKPYWVLFFSILVFAFLIRVIPPQNNNFFFTMDQGNDAVHVRELTERGQLPVKGPETGIAGLYAGPGWYYFIGVGYKLFNGHPYGALFVTILLGVATTAFIMWQLKSRVSPYVALFIGTSLQFYWFFYDTSRWAFNPFPLVFLSFWFVFLLVNFLQGKKRSFVYALIPIALGFNAEVAGSAALFVFHFLVGLHQVIKKKIALKFLLGLDVVLPTILLLPLTLRLFVEFVQSKFIFAQTGGRGFFSSTTFGEMGARFGEIFSISLVPQSLLISILVFVFIFYLFAKNGGFKDKFAGKFVSLVIVLFIISYLLFSLNSAWRDWHTVYLYPLLFVSFLLMLAKISKKAAAIVWGGVIISQLLVFVPRYLQYLQPSNDVSVLKNEMSVVDYVYSKNEGNGFDVYVYTPHVYDYNWQYLFWWQGKNKYGFVPGEYTIEPGFLKDTYVPSSAFYAKPQIGCGKIIFLVIEPGGDPEKFDKWYEKASKDTTLVEEAEVGGVRGEKRTIM